MAVPIEAVVDEAIRYEKNLASLYLLFSEVIADDAELWWELSASEEKHALLLESSRALFAEEFSRETLPADLGALRASNDDLEATFERLQREAPSREQAFRISLGFENDDNEHTLHRLLEIGPMQPARKVVDRIQREDSTHAQKIVEYAGRLGISL